MPTKLGPVAIEITLANRKALQQIADLKNKALSQQKEIAQKKADPSEDDLPRPTTARTWLSRWDRSAQARKRFTDKLGADVLTQAERGAPINPASGVAHRFGFVGGVAGALGARRLGRFLRGAGRVAARAAVPLAITVGAPVAAGLIVEKATGAAVKLAAFARTDSTAPVGPGEVQAMIEAIRSEWMEFRTIITSFLPTLEKLHDVNRAAQRLTGDLPNSKHYAMLFNSVEQQEQQLEDRFTQWRTREAPLIWAQTLTDVVSRSVNK
jgi:hypothetical protein